jgi:hypothetical protein
MPFGRRWFQSLVVADDGTLRACFLPIDDLTAPSEYETEAALRTAVQYQGHGGNDREERRALKAFENARKRKGT